MLLFGRVTTWHSAYRVFIIMTTAVQFFYFKLDLFCSWNFWWSVINKNILSLNRCIINLRNKLRFIFTLFGSPRKMNNPFQATWMSLSKWLTYFLAQLCWIASILSIILPGIIIYVSRWEMWIHWGVLVVMLNSGQVKRIYRWIKIQKIVKVVLKIADILW